MLSLTLSPKIPPTLVNVLTGPPPNEDSLLSLISLPSLLDAFPAFLKSLYPLYDCTSYVDNEVRAERVAKLTHSRTSKRRLIYVPFLFFVGMSNNPFSSLSLSYRRRSSQSLS